MKQSVKVTRIDHCNSLFLCSHALIYEVTCDLKSSLSSSLTVTCLQHVQFLVLNSKLHILHISVVIFQSLANLYELSVSFRELLFHLSDRHRSTNAGNNVLALCVDQELTHQFLLACSRVTCEGNTSTTVIAHVTESHGLYVYSSTPGVRDIVVTTVYVCTRVIPGTEYGFNSAHQLFLRIIREIGTDFFFVFSLELSCQLFQILSGKLNVESNTFFSFHLIDELFKVFLTNFHNYIRVHLDKSSVAVPSPTRIAGLFSNCFNNCFVQTKVQDSIHHTRHGSTSTGTNGNKQRILAVTELFAGDLFHLYDVLIDLTLNLVVDLSAILVVLSTSFSCNGKALRYRKTKAGHLGKVSTFSTKELTHVGITFTE